MDDSFWEPRWTRRLDDDAQLHIRTSLRAGELASCELADDAVDWQASATVSFAAINEALAELSDCETSAGLEGG